MDFLHRCYFFHNRRDLLHRSLRGLLRALRRWSSPLYWLLARGLLKQNAEADRELARAREGDVQVVQHPKQRDRNKASQISHKLNHIPFIFQKEQYQSFLEGRTRYVGQGLVQEPILQGEEGEALAKMHVLLELLVNLVVEMVGMREKSVQPPHNGV